MEIIDTHDNILSVNGRNYKFDNHILEIKKTETHVFVVTIPFQGNLNNVYGVSLKFGTMWRIQKANEVYPSFYQTPFVGISITKNEIVVTDFLGCRFVVDPENGRIIGRKREVK